jgi:mannose-6-phosphate isomerase-like protein (cupin superfamily)
VRKPIFLAAGEGRHPGATLDDTFVFKLGGRESGSTFEVAESRIRPNAGPPLHIHDTEDEAFCVVSGTFRVRVGDQAAESGPGALCSPLAAYRMRSSTSGRQMARY